MDWKVIVPGIGLAGLAVYQFSIGDMAGGIQSVFAALAALGVKVGFDRQSERNERILAQNERILEMGLPHPGFRKTFGPAYGTGLNPVNGDEQIVPTPPRKDEPQRFGPGFGA